MKIKFPIKTRRLIIREIENGDFKELHSFGCLPEVWKYVPHGPNTEIDTKKYIKWARAQNLKKPRFQFRLVIIQTKTGNLIGDCNIIVANPVDRGAHLGYALHPAFWNKGFATETVKGLIRFGFKQLSLHRIYATCDTKNLASKRVLEKAGMKYEGTFRKDKFQKGKWRDTHQFAIVASR
ncbi:MAG TPA: GNAT family N-acetyltransferase [bacterium]|nr:GNAT family N-acetyltransferase [bacterium]